MFLTGVLSLKNFVLVTSLSNITEPNCSCWTSILHVSTIFRAPFRVSTVKTAHQVVNLVDGRVSRTQNLGSTYCLTRTSDSKKENANISVKRESTEEEEGRLYLKKVQYFHMQEQSEDLRKSYRFSFVPRVACLV